MKTIWIILITFAVTSVIVGADGYAYMENKIKKEKLALQTEIDDLTREIKEISASSTGENLQPGSVENYYPTTTVNGIAGATGVAGATGAAGGTGAAGAIGAKGDKGDTGEFLSVKTYGATGNGITDDTTAVQNALDASYNVYFPKGAYIVSNLLIALDNTNLYGDGQGSVLQFKTGSTGAMIDAGSYIIQMSHLNLYGGNDVTQKAVGASTANRTAISLLAMKNHMIHHITIHGFANYGIYTADTSGVTRLSHLKVSDSTIYNTWCAIYNITDYSEYTIYSNLDLHDNRIGFKLVSGNIFISNSKVNDNAFGVWLIGTGITNNGHGSFIGGSLNHNTYPIYAKDITIGFLFNSVNIFDGTIYLESCSGVVIDDGIIDIAKYQLKGGGRNYIRDNFIYGGRANTVSHNYGGVADNTILINNFYANGTFLESGV